MNIVVTGAYGFIGQNLCIKLTELGYKNIVKVGRETSQIEFVKAIEGADIIFHLAGINRPKIEAEFFSGNRDLTKELVDILTKNNLSTPVIYSSSIQALLDNPYGNSKKEAELILNNYSTNSCACVYNFRLPNVFGKLCKPNYNSVVATFCYNIGKSLPVKVNDPDAVINLVSVDYVISCFIEILEKHRSKDSIECLFKVIYCDGVTKIRLSTLVEILNKIRNKEELSGFSFSNEFKSALKDCYFSYL